jgi:hypothetical protein
MSRTMVADHTWIGTLMIVLVLVAGCGPTRRATPVAPSQDTRLRPADGMTMVYVPGRPGVLAEYSHPLSGLSVSGPPPKGVIDFEWLIIEGMHYSAGTGKQSGLCCCVTLSGTGWPWSYKSLLDRSLGPTASLNAQLWLGVVFHEEE